MRRRRRQVAARDVLESLPVGAWIATHAGVLLQANAAFYGVYALPRGGSWLDLVHAADVQAARALWQEAVYGGGDFSFACRLRGKDARLGWVHVQARARRYRRRRGERQWIGTCTPIQSQAERAAKTSFQDRVLRILRDSNIIAVLVVRDRLIIEANDAFLNLLGYNRRDFEAGLVNWETLTPPEFSDMMARTRMECLGNGVAKAYDKEYVKRDGSRVPVTVGIALVSAEPFEVVGFVIDRTESQRLLTAEREARLQAEQLHGLKSDFLRIVSHELRTPLTAILGWSQILATDSDELNVDLAARAARVIERNARAELRIVEDLLAASEMMGSQIQMAQDEVDFSKVVDAAVSSEQEAALAKGLHLTWGSSGAADRAYLVLGDSAKLSQVIGKLVRNAIKFTPPGGQVAVHLSAHGHELAVSVKDSGCGISPAFMPHLFDLFSQAESGATRSFGGLGIGLALVRAAVIAHGGKITAISAGVGQGAELIVTLPRLRPLLHRVEARSYRVHQPPHNPA